jgi:phosphoadenosine phosphosulfate reductase
MLDYMDKAKHPALFYSGGKDSLATLMLLRPWWHKLEVVWVDTGNKFPEVVQHMERVARQPLWRFTRLHSDAAAYIRDNGHPVDVVPTASTTRGIVAFGRKAVHVCSRFDCCGENIWTPMAAYMCTVKPDIVLRGDRSDERAEPPAEYEGMQLRFPIWDWTVDKVHAFICKEAGPIGLLEPRHFMNEGSSLNCMLCTAHNHEYKERMAYLKTHHPEIYKANEAFYSAYVSAVYDEMKELI